MKKFVVYLMHLVLFFSCNKADIESNVDTVFPSRIKIIIVDEAYNDRLNPELQSYFGDDYTKGIEVLYLCDNKKVTFLEYYKYLGGGSWWFIDDVENHEFISHPVFKTTNDSVGLGTPWYFFIECSSDAMFEEAGQVVSYTYIRYPDGSEDEIKAQRKIWSSERTSNDEIGGGGMSNDKIWINGELAYEFSMSDGHYYNPKFYPWMQPVFDNNHIQIGVMPIEEGIVVLTK